MFDLILENGLILDGTGHPPFTSNIGIERGVIKLLSIDGYLDSRERINLGGLAVAPGFIDGHTHGEGYTLSATELFLGKLSQGVTTEILGNCGLSVFPVAEGHQEEVRSYFGPFVGPYQLDWNWTDYYSLQSTMRKTGLLINAGSLVGHGSLRIAAMGFAERKPSSSELDRMIDLLEEAFSQGAVGLSLGLMYPPGLYADLDELVSLAKVAARWNRPVTSHIRNETFHLLDSIEEMITISERSNAKIVISHLKAVGKANWGKVQEAVKRIEQGRERGLNIFVDVYPYVAGNTVLRALLPPWSLEGGINKMMERIQDKETRQEIKTWMLTRDDWENLSLAGGWDSIMILSTKSRPELIGKLISTLSEESSKEPIDFVLDLLVEEDGQVMMLLFTAWEQDLITALKKPYCMVISDGIPAIGRTHPRMYGAFTRFISHYVLDKKMMSLEEGIHRITGLPASVYGLENIGTIEDGKIADLVVFDPDALADHATYDEPVRVSTGIKNVFINGELVQANNTNTRNRIGRIVRP